MKTWLLKLILAAILLGVSIFLIFADDIIYLITGIAMVLFSIIRLIPLLKTLKHETLRTIHIIEMLFGLFLGGFFIWIASTQTLSESSLWQDIYRFGFAYFLYMRGLVYFISQTFFPSKTKVPQFITHLSFLTLGTTIAFYPDFGYQTIGIILMILSLLGTVILSIESYTGFKAYRLSLNEEKMKDLPKENTPHIPVEQPEERTYVN